MCDVYLSIVLVKCPHMYVCNGGFNGKDNLDCQSFPQPWSSQKSQSQILLRSILKSVREALELTRG